MSILTNLGAGVFSEPLFLPLHGMPAAVVAADFNDDAALNRVSVLFSLGAGKFGEPVPYEVGYSPQALLAIDVDDDGVLELAVAEPSNGVEILHNDGAGGFERGPIYGEGALAISSADFNADGKADLAAANSASASVLLNRGDGTFGEARYYPTGGTPLSVASPTSRSRITPAAARPTNSPPSRVSPEFPRICPQ